MKICHKQKLKTSTGVVLKTIMERRGRILYMAAGDYILYDNMLVS